MYVLRDSGNISSTPHTYLCNYIIDLTWNPNIISEIDTSYC